MEGFATGFKNGTMPGYFLENEKYRIQFKGVMCDDTKNIVSHGFEYCYNWGEVMELVLAATEKAANDNTVDIEEAAEEAMKEWLTTFQGWGLLSSVVPAGNVRHFVLSLAYTSQNWDEETGGEYSEEKVFDAVKYVYDNIEGKELKKLLPKFGIWFEEIVSGGENDERKKNFTICFNAKWELEVKFVMEKKRVNRNLVEFAAEAAVRSMYSEAEFENLDMPPTLLSAVRDKYRDAEWVRNHWRLKAELEASSDDEGDSGDFHGIGKWVCTTNMSESDSYAADNVRSVEQGIGDTEVIDFNEHDISDKKKESVAGLDTANDVEEEGLSHVLPFLTLVFVMGGLFTAFFL